MSEFFYSICYLAITLLSAYSLYKYLNLMGEIDPFDDGFQVFICFLYGLAWPISLPVTILYKLGKFAVDYVFDYIVARFPPKRSS